MMTRLLAAFVVFALLEYVLFTRHALRRFTYSCTLSHNRISAGETVELRETIENSGFFPLLWVKTEQRFNEALYFLKNDYTTIAARIYHRSVFSVPPFRRIRRTYKIACQKRGYYRFSALHVQTGDLLGLSKHKLSLTNNIELYVVPVPLPWQNLRLPSRTWLGDMVVRRFILPDPFMPAGVRDYAPGDPLNHIHWKASAKTGGLVVHRQDYTANSRLMAIFSVDVDVNSIPTDDTMETAVRLLADALHFAILNGMSATLHTNSASRRDKREVSVPEGCGRAHGEMLFTAMSEIQFEPTRSLYMLLNELSETVKSMDILIMTRYLSKRIDIEIEALRRAGNMVEVFLIPDFSNENKTPSNEGAAV